MIEHNYELQMRLKTLQHDINNSHTGFWANRLTAVDLILLLECDPTIKKLIREIVNADTKAIDSNESIAKLEQNPLPEQRNSDSQTNPQIKPLHESSNFNTSHLPVVKTVERDPLREGLQNALHFLEKVKSDKHLSETWLQNCTSESDELLTLIIKVGSWDEIIRLHEWLRNRCKTDSRPITEDEKYILETALHLHNKSYNSKKASLLYVEKDSKFDFKIHERASLHGEIVSLCWLPGLVNPAGIPVAKSLPLVECY